MNDITLKTIESGDENPRIEEKAASPLVQSTASVAERSVSFCDSDDTEMPGLRSRAACIGDNANKIHLRQPLLPLPPKTADLPTQADPAPTFECNRYAEYRSSTRPVLTFACEQLTVDMEGIEGTPERLERIRKICIADYAKANQALEKAVGDVAYSYIRDVDSPLLHFSRTLSRRYLDLYTAYVDFESKKGMLNSAIL
ncbi:MAG: hypothetical protein HYZ44_14755 [Bacteroidetes bacterium]|nr:hypothetical protein [Bacteroidota bacterium]